MNPRELLLVAVLLGAGVFLVTCASLAPADRCPRECMGYFEAER